jgi:ligand-binding sensor domain-containing protein/signal transduction histidine kinase
MKLGRYSRLGSLAAIIVANLCGTVAHAQQLSIRHYDVSDGLAHSHVTAIHQDSKGYIWFATWEGLSRFDGYQFTNFGIRNGLGDPIINAITEDREGRLWVAANGGGVSRLLDDPSDRTVLGPESDSQQRFIRFACGDSVYANRVNSLVFDSQDRLWCATDSGLYRGQRDHEGDLKFEKVIDGPESVNTAYSDSSGRLWFGKQHELVEIVGDEIIHYDASSEIGQHQITSVVENSQQRLIAANEREIFEFVPPSGGNGRGTWSKLSIKLRPDQGIHSLLFDAEDTLWIGTWHGLIKYRDGKQTLYTSAEGLSDTFVTTLLEDRDGNLWIGSIGGGVCKFSGELMVSYTKTEGLPNQNVVKVFEDRGGILYASVENGGLVKIAGEKVVPLLGSMSAPFSNVNERIIQDQQGDWWIGTDTGLFRTKGNELDLRQAHRVGLSGGRLDEPIEGGLYKDPSGKIWASAWKDGLFIFDSPYDSFDHVSANDIMPFTGVVRTISDRAGNMWFGAHDLLARYVSGQTEILKPRDGLPETDPRIFFVDSRGWLWIGLRYKGVSVSEDPTASDPQFINYSTANGLLSDTVWAISEDDAGRMYLGTGKGLDQLDLVTGKIRHFNTDDGLASDIINYCFKDSRGNIWVATSLGISKFNPRAERTGGGAPSIYLSRVQVAGEDIPMPVDGASFLPEVELAASRNNLLIDFVALSFQGEHKLRYQYRLEGSDTDWSLPGDSRSVNYAHLSPGSYTFLVRAISDDGTASSEPASFRFQIVPPIWLRAWFIALVALIIAFALYSLYRYRVSQLLRLERIRTRIATDLHDDIGANLSLIAMLSEVARRKLDSGDAQLKQWFETIATTSRDTVDSMSDIVWAINPNRDQLGDLTRRMRRFAEDASAAQNVTLRFNAPDLDRNMKLEADQRREIFLIFKEMINNAMRHSGCSSVNVDLAVSKRRLALRVTDDGRGLNGSDAGEGTGLGSMRGRASRLGGDFVIESAAGLGTTVKLDVPVVHTGRI